MAIAYVMGNVKRFTYVEIGSAMAVCAGLITFAAGDWSLSHPQFHPFGLTLVTLSVFADAILPNAQEKLFRTYDASKSEVMFFTNIYTLVVQTGSAFLSGDLLGMLDFVMGRTVQKVNYFSGLMGVDTNSTVTEANDLAVEDESEFATVSSSGKIKHTFILYMMAYIIISHIAVSAHTAVVKNFGGVAAVFVGTARKGMTLILSFALFPKESNWKYAVGGILVLGGLTVASLEKQRNKRNKTKLAHKTSIDDGNSQERRGNHLTIDPKIAVPVLPLGNITSQSRGHLGNGNGDISVSEQEPLINLDLEFGRSSSA
eukprot:CAMPEP_0181115250 /NCGR_PEP_ID=MMETSP1071-20121207/21331_1 /TAXON_ID=35127 /ORGANISM="Thalassiosira sp., Strain NH16" /LENGTH=314 /DNA_ID=CAMNT_0023199443 /DNA_START=510 /DNA_END=1450 /DNA_ORIENTATION=+